MWHCASNVTEIRIATKKVGAKMRTHSAVDLRAGVWADPNQKHATLPNPLSHPARHPSLSLFCYCFHSPCRRLASASRVCSTPGRLCAGPNADCTSVDPRRLAPRPFSTLPPTPSSPRNKETQTDK